MIAANLWRIAALCLAALLVAQTVRLANAQRAHAQAVAVFNEAAANAERGLRELTERYRTLEGNYRHDLEAIANTYAREMQRVAADADRATAARDSMRRDLADYIERHRAAAIARAAAGECTPDGSPLDLLAELQRRADERAGELARIADDNRRRGSECEARYDAAHALTEAARHAQAR